MATLLFLQNINYEFLGPMYISSMVKRHGHECQLVVGQTLEDFAPVLDRVRPDLVGFSVMTGTHGWARDIAARIKRKYGIPNIFGGAHATFFPQFGEAPPVDLLVRGEGEESTLEVLDRLDSGKPLDDIPNLCIRRNGSIVRSPLRRLRGDLDDYPFPDRHLYDCLNSRVDRGVCNVISSRGCPFHCSFCFEDAMRQLYKGKGPYVRIRRVQKVLEECVGLKTEMDVRVIYFADDVFGLNKSWLYRFLPLFKKEVGLPFVCLVRADIVASDEEYAFRLADGGCSSVFFGIESGNELLRNRILNKQLKDKDILKAAELLHRAGIRFRTYNMMGLPDETLEDALATVELNIRIKTDYPWCSVFSPLPGTELTDYAVRRGYLKGERGYDCFSPSFFVDSRLDLPDIRQMVNLQKFFQTAVLWPWTLPIIKRLIRLDPNHLFVWWFGFVYFLNYVRSERRRFWESLKSAFANYRHVLGKRRVV
ncbi:MAG TPA: radical SAM protein [Phycisphaerae bacterium]|nr:radical SAM protein [Phycisphaerae bacterium]